MDNYNDVSGFEVEKRVHVPRQWFGMALFSMLFFVVFSAQSNDEVDHMSIVMPEIIQEGSATSCYSE